MEGTETEMEKSEAEIRHEKATEKMKTSEMEIVVKLSTNITDKISDLISQLEDIKFGQGTSPRTVRQWKGDESHAFEVD